MTPPIPSAAVERLKYILANYDPDDRGCIWRDEARNLLWLHAPSLIAAAEKSERYREALLALKEWADGEGQAGARFTWDEAVSFINATVEPLRDEDEGR